VLATWLPEPPSGNFALLLFAIPDVQPPNPTGPFYLQYSIFSISVQACDPQMKEQLQTY
jgi:hypothetical protein